MIATIALSAGIDRVYQVPNFAVGQYHRPDRFRAAPGGKGINVARILRKLGMPVVTSGFAGGTALEFMRRELAKEGILADFVRIEEESRRCISIIDPKNRTSTRVDELGPLVTPSEIARLKQRLPELLEKSRLLVVSGAVPRGVPINIYAEIIELAKSHDRPTILDTRDEPLIEGAKAKPMMLKPNLEEFQQLVGEPVAGTEAIQAAARELVADGVEIVFVSMGARGAVVATAEHGNWVARPPEIDLVSPVGAGDALVAGFAEAFLQGVEMRRAIARGVGAGAAAASNIGPVSCTREQIMQLAAVTEVTRLT